MEDFQKIYDPGANVALFTSGDLDMLKGVLEKEKERTKCPYQTVMVIDSSTGTDIVNHVSEFGLSYKATRTGKDSYNYLGGVLKEHKVDLGLFVGYTGDTEVVEHIPCLSIVPTFADQVVEMMRQNCVEGYVRPLVKLLRHRQNEGGIVGYGPKLFYVDRKDQNKVIENDPDKILQALRDDTIDLTDCVMSDVARGIIEIGFETGKIKHPVVWDQERDISWKK